MERIGEYIYMGMVDLSLPSQNKKDAHTTCVSVGYTRNYALKKMKEVFDILKTTHFVSNARINKVKVGEKTHCEQEFVKIC